MFKKLLFDCDMTQEQLADKLNVTQALVSKWVTGKCVPKTQMLPSIAKILKVDVGEVVACFVPNEETA